MHYFQIIHLVLSLIDLSSNSNSNTQFFCDYGESIDFPEFKLKNKNNDFYLLSFCEDYISHCWSMDHTA